MVRLCAVFQCPNSQKSTKVHGSPIHLFPHATNNNNLRDQWIQSIGTNIKSTIINLDNYGVCSLHFNDQDYAPGSHLKSTGLLQTSKPSKFSNLGVGQAPEICT